MTLAAAPAILKRPLKPVILKPADFRIAKSSPAKPVERVSTLPSYEAYVVDVPEASQLKAEFEYHYFVPDEGSISTGAVPSKFLSRSGETFDAGTLDLMRTRVPRLVKLSFTPPLPGTENSLTDAQLKEAAAAVGQTGRLIAQHLSKIVTEDSFSSGRFTSLTFQDGNASEKMQNLVSSSYSQLSLESAASNDASHYRAALQLSDAVPLVDRAFIASSMAQPSAYGARFFGRRGRQKKLSSDPGGSMNVTIGLQIGSKLVHDVVERAVADPHGHFSADLQSTRGVVKRIQRSARIMSNPAVSDDDYKANVQYAFVRASTAGDMPIKQPAKIVGYVIDRVESLADGSTKVLEPIIIENPVVGTTVDLRIKYGAAYAYAVRTIASFTFPAIDDETGNVVLATALISSRPSNKAVVRCIEDEAPPPPADVGFVWNYDSERLMVRWAFPSNPQRDVKRFQVFRRSSIGEAFELVKMYDFDDSTVPIPQRERPDPGCVELLDGPKCWYVDEDFTRDSRYVYAVGCVDAHGNVSAYSAQFLVWFDRFRNKLLTQVVSHLGAPKQYPNMYLEADTFVDTIRDAGHSRLNVYFTPECYQAVDNDGAIVPAVVTDALGGSYRLQLINPDAQKMSVVDMSVLDRRPSSTPA